MKKFSVNRGAVLRQGMLAAVIGVFGLTAQAAPLLTYNFNDSGTTTASTGSDTSAATLLTMKDASNTAADLHGAAGSGLTGDAGDLAFNNTASTSPGTGGRAVAPTGNIASLDGLKSFTVSGWINLDTGATLNSQAYLVNYAYSGADDTGFRLFGADTGRILVGVNGTLAAGSSGDYWTGDGWMFFAATYDSTLGSNNVKFYHGSATDGIVVAGNQRDLIGAGAVATPLSGALGVGNSGTFDGRPFDGLMDNIHVFGSTTDGSGALTLSELQAVATSDLAIPEPASIALMLAGGGLMLRGASRR